MARIHILGASGSGKTTLGAALAARLGVVHADSDSFYWLPTDPPFTTVRPAGERVALLRAALPSTGGWVFSGNAISWAGPFEGLYDLVVFLRIDPASRMDRLRRREVARYGPRIVPGGDLEASSAEFLAWAATYDTEGPERSTLAGHEAWLARQPAPVLRLDSTAPVPNLVTAVLAAL